MGELTKALTVDGLRFKLGGRDFDLQGLSFFNALFNAEFNRSSEHRGMWLQKFRDYGINTLRVWCQWDLKGPCSTFIDTSPESSVFSYRGEINEAAFDRLKELIVACDSLDMVVEVVAFVHERYILKDYNLFPEEIIPVHEKALVELTRRLLPYGNVILQIWNECSFALERYFCIAKSVDPRRIVTNSPGFAGDLGDDKQNRLLDILTPHTARSGSEKFWETGAMEIKTLMDRYRKPVIDDEPARNGIAEHGGIQGGTRPWQHIEQIKRVRAFGGYHIYHHDMFQSGYGNPAIPPHGIPDPEFSEFHREVFAFIKTLGTNL